MPAAARCQTAARRSVLRRFRSRAPCIQHAAQRPAHAVHLIQKIENDADAFAVHAKLMRQILYQPGARNIQFGESRFHRVTDRDKPLLLDPEIEGFLD